MRMVKKKTYKEIDCPNGKELYETIVNTIAMFEEDYLKNDKIFLSNKQIKILSEYHCVKFFNGTASFMGMQLVVVDNHLQSGILDDTLNKFVSFFRVEGLDK